MINNHVLKIGLVGTVIAALCCFTPLLVIVLSTVGLTALIGGLDVVLLPALVMFIAITVYALWKHKTAALS